MDPIKRVNRQLFLRYHEILLAVIAPPLGEDRKTSIRHLRWMCQEALAHPDMYVTKELHWLGFIQGVMATQGLLDIDDECDYTEPLYHQAYLDAGMVVPVAFSPCD